MSALRNLSHITGRADDIPVTVKDLRLDSRMVCQGDVFFALATNDVVGQQHIAMAIAAGAVAVVQDESQSVCDGVTIPVVRVPALRATLGKVADHFYNKPSTRTRVIGITGTNGKTSCSHWIAQGWSRLQGRAAMLGTLGCELFVNGIPDAGFRHETGLTTADVLSNHRLLDVLCQKGAAAVAMEVSSHALDQGRVDGIQFDTAVFTNLSRDHLDYHGDMVAYGQAKQLLFERPELQLAVINCDDDFGLELQKHSRRKNGHVQLLTYALKNPLADIGVERYEATGQGIVAEVRTPWGRGALQSKYPGGFNLLNVLAVVGTLCGHGMDLQAVLGVISQLQAVPGRTQIVSADVDDVLVIVDYAHTSDALEKVLVAVREQCSGQLWCVFGCGGNRDQGKRPQMGAVAAAHANRVVITSDNPRDEDPASIMDAIRIGCPSGNIDMECDRHNAIHYAISRASAGDAIVIAGKGHEAYQEINGERHAFSDVAVASAALQLRQSVMAGVAAS